MKAISDILIHFLGRSDKENPQKQFNIFKLIIENGLRCSPINTSFSSAGKVTNYAICFTDMPLNFCDEHTSVYGKFGIGFTKSFVKNVGGNPARYFVDYNTSWVQEDIEVEGRGLLYANLTCMFQMLLSLTDKIKEPSFDGFYDQNGQQLYSRDEIDDFTAYLQQCYRLKNRWEI